MNRFLKNYQVRPGRTVQVDHMVQTFTIEIRSLSGADQATIKRLLQAKYEVLDVQPAGYRVIAEV